MKLYKVWALIYADFMIMRNTKWRIMETFYFPLTTIIIWGLFSVFVKTSALEAGILVLAVNVFWSFAYTTQSHVNMQMNEDTWSGSLKQIMASGITEFEYILARVVSSTILSFLVLSLMLMLSFYSFGLTLIVTEPGIIFGLLLATFVASIGLSIFVAGGMIALGREYGFLAWTILQVFILLSAPFYSVTVFQEPIRTVAWIMPYTSVFEATRSLVSGNFDYTLLTNGLYISIVYLVLSLPFYAYIFKMAKKKGWLVRLS